MPIYRVKAPDGKIYRVSGPADADANELTSFLSSSLMPQKEAAGLFGSFTEGLGILKQADEATAFAAKKDAATRKALLEAAESKYRQVGFGEGENIEAIKQLIGGSLGQMVAPIAAGLAATPFTTPLGGLAAATTTGGTQYAIQNLVRQAREQEKAIAEGRTPEEVSVGKAALAATGQAALDVAGGRVFSGVAKMFPFMRPLLGKANAKATEKAGQVLADAAEKGTISYAKGIATGVGKGIGFEMPQEVAQQWLERWQAGLPLFDDDAQAEYKQAILGSLVLGGGLGGISGAISTRGAKAKARAAEAAPTEAAPTEAAPVTPPEALPEGVAPAEGRTDIFKFREGITSQLNQAAGPKASPFTEAAIKTVGRKLSSDLATNTPESLDESAAFLQTLEDRIESGMNINPDIAESLRRQVVNEDGTPAVDEAGRPVYEGALVQAKRMVEEARKNLEATQAAQAAATTEAAPVAGVEPVAEAAPVAETAAATEEGAPAVTLEGVEPTPEVSAADTTQAPPPPITPASAGVEATPAPKMDIAPDWFVKYADQFGQAELADNWARSVFGTEQVSPDLETAPLLERAQTMQAGQQRLLQRDKFDPIVEAAGNMGVNIGDFNWFLLLRGAADRNRMVAETNPSFPEGGSSVTTAEAAEGLKQIADEGLLPKYNALAKKVDELVDFNLEEDVKAGLLSKEQAKELREKQPFYVPLKGFAANGDMLTADIDEQAHSDERRQEALQALRAASPGGSVREYRQAFGRGSMPFAPLFNLMNDSEQRIRRRILNKARLPILRQWQKNPQAFSGVFNVYSHTSPKMVPTGKDVFNEQFKPVSNMEQEYYRNRDQYMVVKDKGVPYYIEFTNSPEGLALKRMFANMNPKDLEGAAKTAADINNFLKGMLTYKNPLYLTFVAPFRDMSAAIATAMHHQNLKGSPAYKKNLAGKTAFYALPFTGTWGTIAKFVFTGQPMDTEVGRQLNDMIREGGATLHTRFLNAQEKANAASQAIRRLQGTETLSPKDRAVDLGSALNRWIDGLADLMDMSARFATYRAAIDLNIAPADAARLALDSSLNLTRRGEKARNLDIIFPFFGAGIEATRKTGRILKSGKGAAKILGALIVYGVLESLWNAAHSSDEDKDGKLDYLNLDQGANLRASRITLFYGDGADDYVKVPIDQMIGYFKFVGNRIGDVMAGALSPGDATAGLIGGAASLVSPVRIPMRDLPSVATAFTPLVGKPIIENIINQNFFGSPIYKETTFDNAPRSEVGRPGTGEGYKWLAQTMNDITGGSPAVRGVVDFQPEVYRHMIEGYLGGPYQLAKQVIGLKEAEGVADVPGIKSFVGSGSEYAPQSQYFKNSENIRQIMNRLKKLSPEEIQQVGEESFKDTDPRIVRAYRIIDPALDKVNTQQRKVLEHFDKNPEKYSAEDKEFALQYFREKKNRLYSAFNYVYNTVQSEE